MKKIIFRWLKVVILLYSSIGIALFYLQDTLLFHPVPLPNNTIYSFMDSNTREIFIPYDQQTVLNIIEFKPKKEMPVKGVVLYFHGNRRNIGWYAKYASRFTMHGYEIWMIDYPGFGKSTGTFTEQKLYDYALQFYKLARTRYQPGQIILYGKSLGTCVASQLASVRDCKMIILETPCYSMTSLMRYYLPVYPVDRMLHYHFPTNEYMAGITAPVIIFHGSSDGIIPYSNAEKLKPLLKRADEFVTISGGSHNDLPDFPLYDQKMDSLLSR